MSKTKAVEKKSVVQLNSGVAEEIARKVNDLNNINFTFNINKPPDGKRADELSEKIDTDKEIKQDYKNNKKNDNLANGSAKAIEGKRRDVFNKLIFLDPSYYLFLILFFVRVYGPNTERLQPLMA